MHETGLIGNKIEDIKTNAFRDTKTATVLVSRFYLNGILKNKIKNI